MFSLFEPSRFRFGGRGLVGGGDQEGVRRDREGFLASGEAVVAVAAADCVSGVVLPRRGDHWRRTLRGQSGGLQGCTRQPGLGWEGRGGPAAVDRPQRLRGGSKEGGR